MRPSAEVVRTLFENAPRFVDQLTSAEVDSYEELIDLAQRMAAQLSEVEQIELIDGHPRIGATPATVSATSFREQGYDRTPAPDDTDLAQRLTRLNDEYERRFGFRFCVFVAGRPRSEIADLISMRLTARREEELERALSDVFAIARSRLAKLTQALEEAR